MQNENKHGNVQRQHTLDWQNFASSGFAPIIQLCEDVEVKVFHDIGIRTLTWATSTRQTHQRLNSPQTPCLRSKSYLRVFPIARNEISVLVPPEGNAISQSHATDTRHNTDNWYEDNQRSILPRPPHCKAFAGGWILLSTDRHRSPPLLRCDDTAQN